METERAMQTHQNRIKRSGQARLVYEKKKRKKKRKERKKERQQLYVRPPTPKQNKNILAEFLLSEFYGYAWHTLHFLLYDGVEWGPWRWGGGEG